MNKFAITLLALSVSSVGAFANLITNGGFETNTYGGTNWAVYNNGDTGIANWNVDFTSVDIVGTNYGPHGGSFAVDIVGTPGPGGVFQTFSQSAGATYKVSFWAKYIGDPINSTVNATTFEYGEGFDLTTDWTEYSFTYTADTNFGGVELYSLTGGTGNTLVDDISVEAVPEPATMAVLGLGLLAVVRRRRK